MARYPSPHPFPILCTTETDSIQGVDNGVVSPPPLPSPLVPEYAALSSDGKRLFNKAFISLWDYLFKKRRRFTLITNYWAVTDLLTLGSPSLVPCQLYLLTFIYEHTNAGRYLIHSARLRDAVCGRSYRATAVRAHMTALHKMGLISRHSRDFTQPYLQRSYKSQKVFIQLTGKGIDMVHQLDKDLLRIMLNATVQDITTRWNKKGHPNE